jgi:hypothetical protein
MPPLQRLYISLLLLYGPLFKLLPLATQGIVKLARTRVAKPFVFLELQL